MADEDRDKDIHLTALSISGRNDDNTEADLKVLQEVEMGLVSLNTRSLADETARATLRGLCASWRDLNAQRLHQLLVGAQLLAEITVKAQNDPEPDVLRVLATEFSRASASAQVALAIETAIATAELELREAS
jgi:hypothetical protein